MSGNKITNDIESANKTEYTNLSNELDTTTGRRIFIRKVFGLTLGQLCTNLIIVSVAMFNETFATAITTEIGIGLFYVVAIGYLLIICHSLCNENTLRNYPSNIYIYSTLTILMSYMLAVLCVLTYPIIVFKALCGTILITSVLTAFTLQTKYDYTPWAAGLVCCLGLLIFGSIVMFFFNSQLINTLFIVFGLVTFMLYLIIDVQMIVGGKHIKYKFDENDYVLAALCLYLDIINIFLYLIQFFSQDSGNCN